VHVLDKHNVLATPAFTTWVAAVQAVDPSLQAARGSQQVLWSFVGVHVSFVVQYAEVTSAFRTWVAPHAVLSQVFLWSQHVVWSFAGVHVSFVVQYAELTSTFTTWVAAVHAVESHVFLASQHVAWSAAMVHTLDTQTVLAAPAFSTWVAAVQAVDPSPQVARGSQQVLSSFAGVHVSFVVQYAELTSAFRTWVAAVHAVLSQVFLWSQHVAWSAAMVHTLDTQTVLAAPAFSTWVAAVQAVDPSPQAARASPHVVWSFSGVHVSLVVQYASLTSAFRTWVAAAHAVLSHVFLWSQHVAWSFAGVQVPSTHIVLATPDFTTWLAEQAADPSPQVARGSQHVS
jgi:uncharacterized membrane protein